MDVNPSIGARVTKLMLGTTNVMVPFACSSYNSSDACNSSGTTFWTSPQSAWDGDTSSTGDWPPVKEIDGGAYTAAVADNHLTTTGSSNSTLGASVTKDFSADDNNCWITIQYTIKATKSIKVAPWQITRVTRGGLAFFPAGPTTKAGPLESGTTTSNTTPSVVWFDDKSKSLSGTNGSKLIADGSGGWLAYVLGGNLLLIKYPDVQASSLAPNEGDIEIYADTAGFIELEVQGPYTSLSSNGTLPWTVQMRAVPVPSSVTVAAGDAGLLSFVQEQLAK
jgi:hypothetical protein